MYRKASAQEDHVIANFASIYSKNWQLLTFFSEDPHQAEC